MNVSPEQRLNAVQASNHAWMAAFVPRSAIPESIFSPGNVAEDNLEIEPNENTWIEPSEASARWTTLDSNSTQVGPADLFREKSFVDRVHRFTASTGLHTTFLQDELEKEGLSNITASSRATSTGGWEQEHTSYPSPQPILQPLEGETSASVETQIHNLQQRNSDYRDLHRQAWTDEEAGAQVFAISPSGEYLAVCFGTAIDNIMIIHLPTAKWYRKPPEHSYTINHPTFYSDRADSECIVHRLVFSPDDSMLSWQNQSCTNVGIWKFQQHHRTSYQNDVQYPHSPDLDPQIAFSGNSNVVAVPVGGRMRLIEIETGDRLPSAVIEKIYIVVFETTPTGGPSEDNTLGHTGDTIALGKTSDLTLDFEIWTLHQQRRIMSFSLPKSTSSHVYSSDLRKLAYISWIERTLSKEGNKLGGLRKMVGFRPKEKEPNRNETLREGLRVCVKDTFDLFNQKFMVLPEGFPTTSVGVTLAFSYDTKYLAAMFEDFGVLVWKSDDGKLVNSFSQSGNKWFKWMGFLFDGRLMVAGRLVTAGSRQYFIDELGFFG